MDRLVAWISGLLSGHREMEPHASPYSGDDHGAPMVNPATGLPMVGGAGGLDVQGNPFGVELHDPLHFPDNDPFRSRAIDSDDNGGMHDQGGWDSSSSFSNPWD